MTRAIKCFKRGIVLGLATMTLLSTISASALSIEVVGSKNQLTKSATCYAGAARSADVGIMGNNGGVLSSSATPVYSTNGYRTVSTSYTGTLVAKNAQGIAADTANVVKRYTYYY